MPELISANRHQLVLGCMEELIEKDNPVRFIDAFVDKLELVELKFQIAESKAEGRPSFNPKILLKLYFYGYLNGIRSSRRLEKEAIRNVELHWLLGRLQPNYHTIADFRKDNPVALKNTFRLFVAFLKDLDLIGGSVVAIDGTKFRASNSKKHTYNQKKIERHLAYIEEKTRQYLKELDQNDAAEQSPEKVSDIGEKMERLKTARIKYETLEKQLTETIEPQISTTDADARALLIHGQVVEVSYNQQAAVDAKHKLVVATHTINRNDRNALTDIAQQALDATGSDAMTILVDKGYHNGKQLQNCQKVGIETIVSVPELVNTNRTGTQPDYLVDKFHYDPVQDTYTCPQGELLKTKGTWHQKKRELNVGYQFKKYRSPACRSCPVRDQCTGRQDGSREIERSEYAEAVEANAQNYRAGKALYRKRQEINEHIFGTIKRQWGYNHTNLLGFRESQWRNGPGDDGLQPEKVIEYPEI
ncbi:IS1182 family transposase [Dyadobacter sp. NIV53]|uniref:IS1182 family transposase n=1 Tax=Dyadobacter sp. NIV53 TaxID=2861765 RepID=UPI001C876B56|nr:IS1182 family transposase [Dyadobacter sp. NIV53]